ncbi:MAG: tetratricopeptide repeat protein [Acidobacteria bacterium]|nr:tetratricopeptide repeat protein [Acidobacteriota bacterium]MYH21677.1 tetratricopeptide repeat protein [Acidobacteriota bacterium]MYK78269.1 tetratricopeptide repeat protein [Acidobacteriota bacterium]
MSKTRRRRQSVGSAPSRAAGRRSRFWLWGAAGATLLGGLLLARLAFPPSLDLAEVPGSSASERDERVRAKVEEARQAVAGDPRSGAAWGRLGSVLLAHEREAAAVAAYQRAVELDSNEPRWPYLLARAAKTPDPVVAVEASVRAAALLPGYAPGQLLRAELLEQAGEAEAAGDHYRRAVALDPRCAPCELGLGRLALAAGDLEASRRHLERVAALQPRARAPHVLLVQVYRSLGELDAAESAARRVGRLDGELLHNDPFMNEVVEEGVSVIGYHRRASVADSLGNQTKAESLYRTLLDAHPEDANGHYNLGNLLARLGRTDEAILRYRRTLEIAPEKAEARFNLGNMFLNQGRLDEAEGEYRTVLETWPDHSGTLTNLAIVLARRDRTAEAVPFYRRAVEADPQNPIANHQLGQILAREGSLTEAIAHFRASLAARPDAGPVHLDLAMALATADDYSGAWPHLVAARETGTDVPREFVEFLQRRAPGARSASTPEGFR